MPTESAHQYVGSSSVRREIVRQLSVEAATTSGLIETLAASESGIYTELSNLDGRGLVREGSEGWELTAHGHLVADSLARQQSVEDLVAADPDYWESHRVDTLPPAFRERLHEIGEYEIVRGERPDVNRHHEVIAERMRTVENCRLVSPIFLPSHDPVIPNDPETKMILTPGVMDRILQLHERGEREPLDPNPESQVRVASVEFGLNVGASYLCLILPTPEDQPETTATLVSETDTAIQWGEELFASLWTDADPVENYLREIGFLDPA